MSQGKRYLLTGASSGIGAALARELAARGYELALAARREDSLRQLAGELEQRHGRKVVVLPLDVTDYEACADVVAQAASRLGGLDGVIAYMESLAAEFHGKPIDTSLLLPGFIDTPLNQDMAKRPFLIDVERGAALIAGHIERHSRHAYVPAWPWALLGPLLPHLPDAWLARF